MASESPTVDYQDARERAIRRDGYACRFCGTTADEHKNEHGEDLHTHHLIPKEDGGQDHTSNLLTVCRSCHRTLESTHAQAMRELKIADEGTRSESEYGRSPGDNRAEDYVSAVRENQPATTKEVADAVGVTRQGADYRLPKLEDEGLVEKDVFGRTYVWSVPNSDA